MATITNNMSLPKLKKMTNYGNWSIQMQALLESEDCWEVVQEGFEEPENTTGYLAAQKKVLKET